MGRAVTVRWRRILVPTGLLATVVAGAAACGRPPVSVSEGARKEFVGSAACQPCHQAIHDRWAKTLMAKVLQDPREHPDAILGDFSTPNPLVTFRKEDVVFTYGSK